MTSDKLEYDSAIGGHVTIADSIQTYHYAAERLDEVQKLVNEIQNPSGTKLAFQKLPKHMLRRAMSHHPKRLPRRYRGIHESQMFKAGNPQTTKRPSRKFRRKPSNLLKEYIRRQQKNIWLETHIWHAKRFHMVTKWGYKLPQASCAKTFRACYRASSDHCLLQDVSYLGCIEIKGDYDVLKLGFDRLTSEEYGLRIAAKTYSSGKREGSVHLFKVDQYPSGALGKVSFIWKPVTSFLEISRIVWMFAHPSIYRDVVEELISVFNASSDQNQAIEVVENDEARTVTKSVAYTRCPSYSNNEENTTVTELKDTMNRFRLTGPLSQSVLASAFKCKVLSKQEPDNWFKDYHSDVKCASAHSLQTEFWDNCKAISSSAMLAPNMIIGLTVEDPRLNRPLKRSKAVPELKNFNQGMLLDLPEQLCGSPIWDSDIRTNLTKSMISTHEMTSKRNKEAIVPGERCKFEDELQPVPLLLIQRPGSQDNSFKKLGYGCGYDVIVPSGYGMAFWLCLIMWGARPGGLRESNSIDKESGYDEHNPDSLVGRRELVGKYLELKDKYFRLPPNKRINYRKLGIACPFSLPFVKLLSEWKSCKVEIKDFYVMRDRQLLEKLSAALHRNQSFPPIPDDCLIPLNLRMKGRGNPGDFALICLPKPCDIKTALKRRKFHSSEPLHVEPLHQDCNENARRKLRSEHKRLLKRLRNRRVREKQKKQESSDQHIKIRPSGATSLVSEQFQQMCKLWLPDVAESSIRNQASREVFGYVTQSSFSFTEASVTAVGYVSGRGLRELVKLFRGRGERMCLVRGTRTRNYRFASFRINCLI